MKGLFNKFAAVFAAVSLSLFASMASAQTAYDGITAAVDWSDVITGVTAVGALLAAVFVVKRGVRMIISMIGR